MTYLLNMFKSPIDFENTDISNLSGNLLGNLLGL